MSKLSILYTISASVGPSVQLNHVVLLGRPSSFKVSKSCKYIRMYICIHIYSHICIYVSSVCPLALSGIVSHRHTGKLLNKNVWRVPYVSVEQYTICVVIPQYYFLVLPNFCNTVVPWGKDNAKYSSWTMFLSSVLKGSVQWKNDLGLYCSLVLVMNIGMCDLVILCLVYRSQEF